MSETDAGRSVTSLSTNELIDALVENVTLRLVRQGFSAGLAIEGDLLRSEIKRRIDRPTRKVIAS